MKALRLNSVVRTVSFVKTVSILFTSYMIVLIALVIIFRK